ncbi:MAG: hypothetical protein ACFCVH_01275 [Alphaproteobacteria bacterium]
MINRLHVFAVLSLTAIGIGAALVVRDYLQITNPDMGEIALVAGLTALDILLILLAAANLRWAQYIYAGLFGAGLHNRISGLFDLMAADPAVAIVALLPLSLHVVAIVVLVLELRAQRDAARLNAARAEPRHA